MKNFLFLILIFPQILFAQYPIQTIFKGDSVVILTLKQSEDINKSIEKTKDINRENKNKIAQLYKLIDSLNQVINTKNKEISYLEYKKDSIQKENEEFVDSIWMWSLSPSIIFTRTQSDSFLYIIDLSRYYLTTDDYGIFLPRISNSDYKEFLTFLKNNGGEDNSSRRGFGGLGNMVFLGPETVRQKRVWKHKSQWKNK